MVNELTQISKNHSPRIIKYTIVSPPFFIFIRRQYQNVSIPKNDPYNLLHDAKIEYEPPSAFNMCQCEVISITEPSSASNKSSIYT